MPLFHSISLLRRRKMMQLRKRHELLVEAMNGEVKQLFSSKKQIELEIRALAATISRFIKQSDQWLSVTHSMNTAIKKIETLRTG